jgi:phosphatidylserine/phosphatidylglycerophosphate/cardiolipin synthase-like enzyme
MLTDILRLSDPELEQLLGALAQGTIRPGGSTSQVRRAGIADHAELVQSWLPEAMDQFGSIPALAAAIRLLRADRGRREREGPHPELIMTGPALDDDPNRDTRVVVREVFESARRSLLIVGYAFFGSDRIFEPLARRMGQDPALRARLVVNIHPREGCSVDQAIRRFVADFLRMSWPFHPRPEIYYLPGSMETRGGHRASVHAKLIVADGATIYLGSANFTTAAFERNIEAGIRLTSESLGSRLTSYFDRMIDQGILSPLPLD